MARPRTLLAALAARWKLGPRAAVGRGSRVLGRVWVHGGGQVRLGEGVLLDGRSAPIELHARPGAEIVIGDGAAVEGGTSFDAVLSLRVGARARLGPFCKLLDNHLHPLRGDRHRSSSPSMPVVVGPEATLGARVILLPGAAVADGGVVAHDTVVRPRPQPRAPSGAAPGQVSAPPPAPPGLLAGLSRRASLLVALLRARVLLRRCARGRRVFAYSRVDVVADGPIRLGDRVGFTEGMIPTALVCHQGATLSVGDETMFNYGATIEAFDEIRIGRGCMLAAGVRVCDRDADGASGPILIGDEVWIAHGASVRPGVSIGDRSVVAAGAVVARDVPPGSLVIGAPARCMSLELVARAPG